MLTISAEDFIQGASFSKRISLGGLSPEDKGVNLFKEQATVLYPQPLPVDITGLEDDAIEMILDPEFGGNDAFILDKSGKFYTLDGTTLTKRQTDATNTYVFGTSKMVVFKGDVYASSQGDIALLDGTNLSTLDHDWWTNTKSKSALQTDQRHDLVVIEDTLYIPDGNSIHTWDGTTAVEDAIQIPTDMNIITATKHPNGRDLIVFASRSKNYSHTLRVEARVYVIDTNTSEFISETSLDDQVEGVIDVGGGYFITSGDVFGILNGSSVDLIRKITKPSTAAVYKPKMTNFDGVVMVVDNNAVLAYGDLNGLGDIPFYPYYNNDNQNEIKAILAIGSKQLLVAYSTNTLKKLDFNNSDGVARAKTGKLKFPGKVWIRKIEVFLESALSSGSQHSLLIANEAGSEQSLGSMNYSSDGAIKSKEFWCNMLLKELNFVVSWLAVPKGVKRIDIYYESGE